jgi:DNA-binding response OmpR family regulator
MKLLLIENEPELLDKIQNYFASFSFVCECASSFQIADEKVTSYSYDIIVIGITLQDNHGIDLISKIRICYPETGIVILSTKGSLQDKLDGFNLGADDYLTKPFYIEELNARINALFRRKVLLKMEDITFDGFTIDLTAKVLLYNNVPVGLTRKEYEMLIYFVMNKNRVLSKSLMTEHLWGDNYDQADNFDTLYVHIKNLRKKLINENGKDYIKSVYGMGYKFII